MRQGEAEEIFSRLPALARCWRAGEFGDAVFAALYFFHWQIARHGPHFAARRNKRDPRPEATAWLNLMQSGEEKDLRAPLRGWLERYQFRGVIANVPHTLARWLRGDWPLILRQDIPGPRDILRWQARGCRAVTVLTEYPRLLEPVLGKADAFAFFLHDLEHAYKFFHSPSLRDGQRAFFIGLERAHDDGVFTPYLDDAEFVPRLHYLMSDMNTHPEHSRQYLRAILVETHLRRERKNYREPLSAAAERAIEEVVRTVAPSAPLALGA